MTRTYPLLSLLLTPKVNFQAMSEIDFCCPYSRIIRDMMNHEKFKNVFREVSTYGDDRQIHEVCADARKESLTIEDDEFAKWITSREYTANLVDAEDIADEIIEWFEWIEDLLDSDEYLLMTS